MFTGVDFFVFVTEKDVQPNVMAPNVHIKHISSIELARRVSKTVQEMGIQEARSLRYYVYAGVELDLKLLYGALFAEILKPYTHWGWTTLDGFFGDMTPLLRDLEQYDVVTYPNGVCCLPSHERCLFVS